MDLHKIEMDRRKSQSLIARRKNEIERLKSEIDCRKSEIDRRKSDIDGRKSDIDVRKSDIDGRKSEVDGRKSEVDGRKSEIDGRKSEIDGRKSEIDGQKAEEVSGLTKRQRGCRGKRLSRPRLPKRKERIIRGDDDPFVACDNEKYTLQKVIAHVKKHHQRKGTVPINTNTSYRGGPITPETFQQFSNSFISILFKFYAKLDMNLQIQLRMFYFGLEKSNNQRFKNLTHCLRKGRIFEKYPWLNTDETVKKEVTDSNKKPQCKRKRNNNDEPKPFSEACKQYEIEKRQKIVKIEPPKYSPTTSYLATIDEPIIDKHLQLSQEYQNMIAAINCKYEPEPEILGWSSIQPTEMNKLTPLMHFENRKTKLTTDIPLSLGDLIVLVSYYYKLEYIEQQLLIEKMKILEATKPNQASYLRQYVRTTCPPFDENEIHFKPLPDELILSEVAMDLRNVTCIEDILENDFCVFDDGKPKEEENNEFDFGSAFL